MADQLTDDQISEFKEAFHNFDKDSDGRISPKELGEVFKALGYAITEPETIELIKEIDEKGESIDFYEFLNIIAKKLKDVDNGEELLAAFKVIVFEIGIMILKREEKKKKNLYVQKNKLEFEKIICK